MNAEIMRTEVFESHRSATTIEQSHFIEDVSSRANSKKGPYSK